MNHLTRSQPPVQHTDSRSIYNKQFEQEKKNTYIHTTSHMVRNTSYTGAGNLVDAL